TAITHVADISNWVSLMISKASFSDNIRLEAWFRLGERSQGIGFLLSIPEADERQHLNDGYCLWLSSDPDASSKILRSTVEVLEEHDLTLKNSSWYHLKIEKIDKSIRVWLNDTLELTYVSHIPLTGTHVGILSRDADYEIT